MDMEFNVREIKFRAWNDIDKAYIDWMTLCGMPKLLTKTARGQEKHYSLEQYTGMKDSGDIEIYEGDIVESYFYWPEEKCKAVITYNDADGAFSYNNGDGEQDAFIYGEIYVIGNIHQNPELLEK